MVCLCSVPTRTCGDSGTWHSRRYAACFSLQDWTMAAPSSGRRSVGGKNDRSGGGGSRAKPWGVCNSSYPRPVVSTLHLTRVFQRHCAWQLSNCGLVGEIWVASGVWHERICAGTPIVASGLRSKAIEGRHPWRHRTVARPSWTRYPPLTPPPTCAFAMQVSVAQIKLDGVLEQIWSRTHRATTCNGL